MSCGLRFVSGEENPRCSTGTWGTRFRGLALLTLLAHACSRQNPHDDTHEKPVDRLPAKHRRGKLAAAV